MTQQPPRPRFTIQDYMATPEDKRYQLLDGELILAPAPTTRHQRIILELSVFLNEFIRERNLGMLFFAPTDVVLSDHDVVQPDIFFISSERANILTEANVQGAPDLVVEILSPSHSPARPGIQADPVQPPRRARILVGGPGVGCGRVME